MRNLHDVHRQAFAPVHWIDILTSPKRVDQFSSVIARYALLSWCLMANQVDASDMTTTSTVVDISSLGLQITTEEVRGAANPNGPS